MRQRTALWFECKIRYEKVMEDGLQKKVTEQYTIDALSYTEAEKRIIGEMSSYISGAFEVEDIKKAAYKEVFFSDEPADDRWWRAKVDFITLDEKTEKEKRSRVTYLVQASGIHGALKAVDSVMGGTMTDYVVTGITETRLLDVFEFKGEESKG